MSFVRMVLALALAALAWTPAGAAPLDLYGKLPSIEDVAMSPSGKALALVVTNGEQRMIVVKDLTTNKITLRAPAGDVKIRDLRWAGDRHLLIVTSVTASPMFILNARREWMMAYTFDLATQKVRPLLRDVAEVEAMNTIVDMPVVREFNGEPTVFVQGITFQGGHGRTSLFRIDLDRSTSRLVDAGSEDTIDWVVGPEGEPVAQELYDGRSGRWTLKLKARVGWREAMSATAPHDPPYLLGLGRDGKSVLVATADDEDRAVWKEARLDEATPAAALPMVDDQSPVRDPYDGRLIGHYTLIGDEGRYTFFDAADARVWKAVTAAYPGQTVDLRSWSKDRRRIVVRVDPPTEGPAYAVVDLDARTANWLGEEYLGLTPADIARQQPIAFKAADGLQLTGYLTLPNGRPAKNLPLVVFPHGGPAARDQPGFDWWAQGMASRGYAVLQVNFRGSDGLGGDLLEAGYGQWGRKMQTDLSDGVRHLAAQGVIDPKRVCIVGASYGGYAALAGATFDPGVYRCAASFAGVADLKRMVAYSRSRGGQASQRYWNRFMGAEDLGDPVLSQYSPAHHAAKAEIPILLIHGKDDTVVPIDQSRIMHDALRKAGKPVELVVQKGEDHHLSRGDTRLQTLTSIVAFLEKHNPPN